MATARTAKKRRSLGAGISRAGIRRQFRDRRTPASSAAGISSSCCAAPRGRRSGARAGARRGAGGAALEAIAFGYVGGAFEDPAVRSGATVELAYRLEINEYNGAEAVQLNCQHLKLR